MKEAASRFRLLDMNSSRHKQFIFAPIPEGSSSRFGDFKAKAKNHPAPVPNFTGRDGDLVKLLKLFNTRSRAFTLLHGDRGVGKTALATTLGRYMFNHDICKSLFVVGPDDSERLSLSDFERSKVLMRKIGEGLRFPGTLSDPKEVAEWASNHRRAFIIFDNCETFMTNKKFIHVLKSLVTQDNEIKVLFITRKAHRNFFQVIGLGSRMPMYNLAGLSPRHAAVLFCKSCPRDLTCAEMGPKSSRTKRLDENMKLFSMSPVMSLFPKGMPGRICRGASLVGTTGDYVSSTEANDWEQHFRLADKDGSGEVDTVEIQAYMRENGYTPNIVKSVFCDIGMKLNMAAFTRIWKEWGPSVALARDINEKLRQAEAANTVPNTYPLHTLTTRDVLMLMRVNGLGMFCREFRDQGVDGSLLSMVETAEDLEDVGVTTALHRRKLFRMIRSWKESMQMVTREELEEAEKMQLCHVSNDLKSGKSNDPRILLAEHLRVQLATSSYMLLRRLRTICKGYLCKSNSHFRKSHWENKTVYREASEQMALLDSEYAIKTTLYAFGRYLSFHLLAMKNMSIFMDDACLVNIYPTMLRSVEFALSGEGVDLRSLSGSAQHPTWGLGKISSGIFQLMSYEQTEIGESMLVPEEEKVLGCRCLSFVEFKKKYEKDRCFRRVFSRLALSCQMLHERTNLHLYCVSPPRSGVLLRNKHRGRVVWLHNQLCSLTLQLDHNLALRQQSIVYDDQETLWSTLEGLKMEQEMQDLMNGYQRKLMCDSIFCKWYSEQPSEVEEDLKEDSSRLLNAQAISLKQASSTKREAATGGLPDTKSTSNDGSGASTGGRRTSFFAHETFRPRPSPRGGAPRGLPTFQRTVSHSPRVHSLRKHASMHFYGSRK